jgi:hypothetical protein
MVDSCTIVARDLTIYGRHLKDVSRKLVRNLGKLRNTYIKRSGNFVKVTLYYENGRVIWYLRERTEDWDFYWANLVVFCPKRR